MELKINFSELTDEQMSNIMDIFAQQHGDMFKRATKDSHTFNLSFETIDTTEEDNLLITEFMEIDAVDVDCTLEEYGELKYHKSWDWIVPVADKILDMELEHNWDKQNDIREAIQELNIRDLHKAVVKFIKWYNQ